MTTRLQGEMDLRAGLCRVDATARGRIRVFVDGDRLMGVLAFSTWRGWVDVMLRDYESRPLRCDGRPRVERRFGRVIAVAERATVRDVEQLAGAGLVAG